MDVISCAKRRIIDSRSHRMIRVQLAPSAFIGGLLTSRLIDN
jgi:hypothetical protein